LKKQKFLSNFQAEFKKIEWPKKDLLIRSSIITIIMVSFFTIYVSGSDFLLSKFIFGIRN
jgi:preprotein translocase, SecE subunit, bacterial